MPRRELLIPGAVFLGALVVYTFTLAPGVAGGDAGEMQFVPYVLGIAHWTGYPLYVMAGKLWTMLIPLGSVAWRMNLLSAVAAAGALALITVAGRRLTGDWLGGLLAALMLGAIPLFWNWAIVAGVRAATVFFAVLVLAVALEWGHAAEQGDARAGRLFLLLAACFGLSLAHHRTIIFLVPGLALYVVWVESSIPRQSRLNWRQLLSAAALALGIPLALYLYIPIRSAMHPPYAIMEANTLRGFLALALAPGMGGGISEPLALADLPLRFVETLRQFGREFSWPLVALGVAGMVWLVARRPKPAALLLAPFVLLVGFTANYAMGGSDLNIVYFLPAYAIFSLCVGAGGAAAIAACRRLGRRGNGLARLVAGLLAALVLLAVARPTWQALMSSASQPLDAYRVTLRGEQAVRLLHNSLPGLPDGSMLIGDWEQLTPFWYAELVDKSAGNLAFHYPFGADWRQWLGEAQQAGQPVFLTRRDDRVIGQRFLSSVGPLVQVRTAPDDAASGGAQPLAARFGDELALVGYECPGLDEQGVPSPGVLSVELYWKALAAMPRDYSISVRLVGEDGRAISAQDNVHPVLSMYPTSLWQPGEVVGDYYELPVPATAAAGQYHVQVRVYWQDSAGFHNLPVVQDGEVRGYAALPPVIVY